MQSDQKSLFDIGLQYKDADHDEEFIDEEKKLLNAICWQSLPRQTFYYDNDNNMKLTTVSVNLCASRRVDIKGKVHYFLERNWKYSGLAELICDEIDVWGIKDLESCLEDEKWLFEKELNLPQDVLFDGHRYFRKFEKNPDGTIRFLEKWYPEPTAYE
jgi:hypothetical protein